MKRLRLTAIPLFAALSCAASAATFDVSQKGRVFQPESIEINVGDTLAIHNDDEFLHHVYIKSPTFNYDSSEQPQGRTVEVKFPVAGDFEVRCGIHPKMLLVVHVK